MNFFRKMIEEVRTKFVPLCIIFIAYLATGLLSVYLYFIMGAQAVIIAPAGIALAGVIFVGYIGALPVALAALALGFLTQPLSAASLVITLGSVGGNVAEALLSLWVLRQFGFERMFFRLKDMFSLVFVAFIASATTPLFDLGAAAVTRMFLGFPLPLSFADMWLGGALSCLILTPVLIRWIERPVTPRSAARLAEITFALLTLVAGTYAMFFTPMTTFASVSMAYFQIAALFWLAFRGGVRFTTLGLFIMAVESIAGGILGTHPATGNYSAQNIELYNLILGTFFFILVSLEEQRTLALRSLTQHAQKLENALDRISLEDIAKNEFIALLGHELRNPLASLLSSVELMRISDPSGLERREILETMDERIRSMAHLLDDILDISRITARKFTLQKRVINLHDVVRRAAVAVEPLMRKQRHTFIVTTPETDIEVEADPVRLEQIVVNLLHNAAKYTPPGGRIDLRTAFRDRHVEITVSDTGIGIAPEMRARIFEPFVQINAKTHRAGGIGVGLSLTKSLIELHGGTIRVESGGEGRGSEFIVALPARRGNSVIPAATAQSVSGSVPSLNILVVDDNEEAAQSLGKLLQLRGHSITIGYDGEHVVASALAVRPDIAILDIGLPGIDGYEVARRLRKANVSSVLIALSGYGTLEDKRRAASAGFDYHLTKPVGLSEIEPLLAKITRTNA